MVKNGNKKMDDIKFSITLNTPIGLSGDLDKTLTVHLIPCYKINSLEFKRVKENGEKESNILELTIMLDRANFDINKLQTPELNFELRRFRDRVVSILSFIAMVPVYFLSKGLITVNLEGKKYFQKSLGPMGYEASLSLLTNFEPLVSSLQSPNKYSHAIYLVWQALNAQHALRRFINLAVCIQILANEDTKVKSRRPRICDKCKKELKTCPLCKNELTINTPLRELANFMFVGKERQSNQFTRARNEIFHGSLSRLSEKSLEALDILNTELLVIVRNYIGSILNLEKINVEDLNPLVNIPEISMTVYYTEP